MKGHRPKFAVCIASEGCDDLQVWKLYRVLPDPKAEAEDYLRVVDESGEDYLYPSRRFIVVAFSSAVEKKTLVRRFVIRWIMTFWRT